MSKLFIQLDSLNLILLIYCIRIFISLTFRSNLDDRVESWHHQSTPYTSPKTIANIMVHNENLLEMIFHYLKISHDHSV